MTVIPHPRHFPSTPGSGVDGPGESSTSRPLAKDALSVHAVVYTYYCVCPFGSVENFNIFQLSFSI